MPADNVIINDGVYTVGEKEFAVIWLEKDGTMFGIKEERKRKRNVFWRASKDVAMEVFTDNVEIDEEKVIEQ